MKKVKLTCAERKQIDDCVSLYKEKKDLFEIFAKGVNRSLRRNKDLSPYIHFIKFRVKELENLREKIQRKSIERKRVGKKPNINKHNLFSKVTDLAGIRVIHLHTEQIQEINRIILSIVEEEKYVLVENPKAFCWDNEYETLFRSFGIEAVTRESMYISVHYVIKASKESDITAELQVRTLMEEVWGEVSHRVNYPNETKDQACRDQLKVLARFTSGCTRLVDSIFSRLKDGGKIK